MSVPDFIFKGHRERNVHSISYFVEEAARPDSYSYSGTVERAQAHAEKTAKILGNLIEHLYNKGKLTLEDITSITEEYGELVENKS